MDESDSRTDFIFYNQEGGWLLVPEELNGYRKPEFNFIGWFPSPQTPVLHRRFMKDNKDVISGNPGRLSKIPHDCSI